MSRNKILVTLFLLGTIAFTALMTFYVGPRLMAVRQEVAVDKHFYKCQKVVSGSQLEIQLRAWERPNTHPVFPIRLAGVDTPPLAGPQDRNLMAWADARGIDPEHAALMAEAAHRTLQAFIRKQNLILETLDGERAGVTLTPGEPVHVFVSGTQVNRKLLASGLALVDEDTAGNYAGLYREAAEQAKRDGTALWAP